ncbi:hypothetical protein RS130_03820 [Paraglaciecola aquimarina]|uniref:Phytase-like domain-containing protein n=1 Tax=Paraglaciecola aquimarina TaxID=1235557 RepID=A0ABU3ST33_9ALTE|nr:hypothetical protein [Paraglaciecola aquimarina]MDU0353176.1 hypothetical protein [Paraglaciecola aquimarina]
MKTFIAITMALSALTSCGQATNTDHSNHIQKVYGHWVKEKNNVVMVDSQPSGLTHWHGKLVTLSDRSADKSHRLKLRTIAPQSSILVGPDMKMRLSPEMTNNCFAEYVSDNPDLEALAVDPDNDKVFYMITEDATSAPSMTESCQRRYAQSGSTEYPRLLVRIEIQSETHALITHVRPIQFSTEMQIGDFPNDGIEALAFGKNRTLYLGVEKDQQKKARLFSLQMDAQFWQSQDFALVSDLPIKLPNFKAGNHPINGMDYYQTPTGAEFLILAARNDETLWIADLSGQKEAKIIPLEFYAEIINGTGVCQDFEQMDNSSIEGVAVIDETLWLINDPWKAVYLNNIHCPQNKRNYQTFSPLLFSLPIQSHWFD